MDPPGSKPIMQETGGSTETEEVPVVTTTLALEMSIDEFAAQREAMIEALAAQYGVDPSLITLDAAAGSVAITVTIAVPPAPPGADGAQASSSLSVDDLLDKVNAVDDSTLGASLATALNMANISVSTTAAPSRATVERTVNVVCPVGHWCTAGRIVPCPMSTYNNRTKQNEATSCLRCPVFSETRDEASTSLDDCVCEESYYDATVGHGVECVECPRGTACSGNATLERLPIEPGKWRTGPDSVVIETCAVEKSCVGGEDPAAYCLEGHKGPLCMVCESGYRLSSTNGCVACEGGSLGATEIVSAAVVGGLLLACVCACCRRARQGGRLTRMTGAKERRYREPSKDSTQRIIDKLLTKFKIVAAHQQVLQALSNVYRIDWPPAFKRLLSYLQVFNFDFFKLMSLDCVFETNYLSLLVVRTVVPLVVVFALICGGRRALRQGRDARGHLLFNGGVLLVFLLYPPITQAVFKFYQVKEFADDYGSFLMADYAIDTSSDAYQSMRPFAALMVLVWPVGVPLIIAVLLWRSRAPLLEIRRREQLLGRAYDVEAWKQHVQLQRKRTRASRRDADEEERDEEEIRVEGYLWALTEAYRGIVFYFEVFEYVLQKLALVGLLVFFQPGTLEQLTLGLILCFTYFGLCAYLMPFCSTSDNLMVIVTQFSLFVTMLSAVIVQHGAEETPPLVEQVLIVAALVPLALCALLAVHLACVETGRNPLGALTRPVEERVTRRVFSQRPAGRRRRFTSRLSRRPQSEARRSSTQFDLDADADDNGLGGVRAAAERTADDPSAVQHARRRSHLQDEIIADMIATHRRSGDTEAPPSDRARRTARLLTNRDHHTSTPAHAEIVEGVEQQSASSEAYVDEARSTIIEAMGRRSVAGAFDLDADEEATERPRTSAVWADEARSTIMEAMGRRSVVGEFDLDVDSEDGAERTPRGAVQSPQGAGAQRLRGATMTVMAGMGGESARRMDAVHVAVKAFEEAGNERRARELGPGTSSASAAQGAADADVGRRKQCRFGTSGDEREAGTSPALLLPPGSAATSVRHAGGSRPPVDETGAPGAPESDGLAA